MTNLGRVSSEKTRFKQVDWKPSYSWMSDDVLEDFYIPALSLSTGYDRKTGYFSSTALAVAAQGIARLIQNRGKIRIIAGCQLQPEDVEAVRDLDDREAVRRNLLENISEPADFIRRERLKALAWMLKEGLLEIRIVYPIDEDGNIVINPDHGIYHEKTGIFTDSYGDKLAFQGSINESANAWKENQESFDVYSSWEGGRDLARVDYHERMFDALWHGGQPGVKVISLPRAVERKLVRLAPREPPKKDPLEKPEEGKKRSIRFMLDAPHLRNGRALAEAFSPIDMWPHQRYVVNRIVEGYPTSFLLCDEVGLGKTIEAGFALKQLLLKGLVERCLLLAPKSILKQWQEELKQKLNILSYRYEGGELVDPFGTVISPGNPWDEVDLVLASTQLVRREEKREELLEAKKWDLLVVDEAHYARRRSPVAADRYRPNKFLKFLELMNENEKADAKLFLTATPMQLAPVELFDLLRVLGEGGRWVADEGAFNRYFKELSNYRNGGKDYDFDFLMEMARYQLGAKGLNEKFEHEKRRELGPVRWRKFKRKLQEGNIRDTREDKPLLEEFFRAHTPLGSNMFRGTRELLRKYKEQGVLKENVPERRVRDPVFIEFATEEEKELYRKIREYTSKLYRRASRENRQGVGFVMTTLQKRFMSSRMAIKRTLERIQRQEKEIFKEDIKDEDISLKAPVYALLERQDKYIRDFISELDQLEADSKLSRLHELVDEGMRAHGSVLIFTQYTDTMDYIREELAAKYGKKVACYSGRRAAEVWDGSGWEKVSKLRIRENFAREDGYKILISTEAASEGLNLQRCSFLINYDMPWNPMKVEQRIGRIDRIGQRRRKVEIVNLFYADGVEARVYDRLGQRINLFEGLVGQLQPILGRVEKAIKDVALAGPEEESKEIDRKTEEVREECARLREENIDVDFYVDKDKEVEKLEPPVTPREVEEELIGGGAGVHFEPSGGGLYALQVGDDEQKVTFSPKIYENAPNDTRLLSYGEPWFHTVMEKLAGNAGDMRGVARGEAGKRVVYLGADGCRRIKTIGEFKNAAQEASGPRSCRKKAEKIAREEEREMRRRINEKRDRHSQMKQDAYKYEARLLLDRLIAAESAKQMETLEGQTIENNILAEKMRKKVVPYRALANLAAVDPSEYAVDQRMLREYRQNQKRKNIDSIIGGLIKKAKKMLKKYKEVNL